MKVIELLKICKGAPYVRIIAGNRDGEILAFGTNRETLAEGYILPAKIAHMNPELVKHYGDTVLEFFARNEVRHRRYKKLGLLPPYRPDITAQYEFKDMQQVLYYDIIVEE